MIIFSRLNSGQLVSNREPFQGRATSMSARSDAHVDAGSVRPTRRIVKTESNLDGSDDVGARGQAATTSLLNDFAGNASVLIKQIDGAHSVIAICDDEFQMTWISDEQQRRKLLAGRDCHMIFSYVRIGYPQ